MDQLTIQQAFNLAVQHHQAGRLQEAENFYRQALALNPNLPRAYCNLGIVLDAKGQLDEAIVSYRQAIALSPDLPEVHNNLGNSLKGKGDFDEAIAGFRRAISLRPDYSEAHNNLGGVLLEKGQIDDAITAYRQAIALNPEIPDVHYNLSLALLTRGDLSEGWKEYEWRWKLESFRPFRRNFTQPLWNGEALDGRTILLTIEQGYGDIIQFIRYLPLVAERGGKIVMECPVALQRLFQPIASRCQLAPGGQPLPRFDLYSPLLNLPRIFGTTLGGVPIALPYSWTNSDDVGNWHRRMGDHGPMKNVGLVWAGRPSHTNDSNRSIKLARMAPLAQVPGMRFFSLQKGHAADQVKTPPSGLELVDWTADLKDFADTAALIANLDLVISVDTAVVHLAGAMGKPVWTLLPFMPDWRWMLERQDTPWYPSMRLFRQPSQGDWGTVMTRVVEALSHWVKNHP